MKVLLICAALTAVDGDTARCDGELLRLLGDGAPNVLGFDAPETYRADCAAERSLGQAATARLRQIIATPGLMVEDSGERDRYGRILASLRLPDGRTAGRILMDEGLAVEWRPGYRKAWCHD